MIVSTFALALPAQASSLVGTNADDQQEQARLYRQTLVAIGKGHRTNTQNGMQALVDYPLYPYLEKAELDKRLHQLPKQDVDDFLAKYPNSVVGDQLLRSWLAILARKHLWQDFIHYYRPEIAGTHLRCHYLEALHETGYEAIALSNTAEVWLTGESQPDSCDPVFKRWENAGLKTDDMVWQRLLLALERGNTLLARYLSKHASAELKPYARRLLSVHASPSRLKRHDDFSEHNRYTADIVSHGLLRLAFRAPEKTSELWVHYRGNLAFTAEQNYAVRDKIARQLIASGSEQALSWLITHDPNAEDSYLLEWRIRLALKDQHWSQAEQWIGLLPEELQQHPRWRYWLARARQQTAPETAIALLESLASERNYYGFLAADRLGKAYGFNNEHIDAQSLDTLTDVPAVARAKIFYDMGELTSARREWLSAVANLQETQLISATQLAHHWGWHQQAIHTTIKANHWDDLAIRFPLAFQHDMTRSAEKVAIPLEWLYAITRQESAFAVDARSSADARGLMQLLPGTARAVAQSIGLSFNPRDLYRPETNIQLGSSYLKQLLDQFEGNHILATAAYNAGPHRVRQWLKNQRGELPKDVLIETLPFHETRNYVQSVLAFSVIYSHRLGSETALMKLSEQTFNIARSDDQHPATPEPI